MNRQKLHWKEMSLLLLILIAAMVVLVAVQLVFHLDLSGGGG